MVTLLNRKFKDFQPGFQKFALFTGLPSLQENQMNQQHSSISPPLFGHFEIEAINSHSINESFEVRSLYFWQMITFLVPSICK